MNSNDLGDKHYYGGFMNDDINMRIIPEDYDKIAGKFISEFGCAGPTRKSSVHRYCGNQVVDVNSNVWKLHTNTWEKGTVNAGIAKHYTDLESLTLDGYLLYGGLFQGLMLEYAFESMRHAENNHGALMWSYNDCWGEVGWSIVDYYVCRKIAYYFVKRALAHRKLVLRKNGNTICIICMNDTMETLEFELEYGYMTFDGTKQDTAARTAIVAPCTKAVVAQMKMGPHDTFNGLYYARAGKNRSITPATLRTTDFRNLLNPHPRIKITEFNECSGEIVFTVLSDKYAHGVHFGLNDELCFSDEYFDLLPGEERTVTIAAGSTPLGIDDINPKYVYVRT